MRVAAAPRSTLAWTLFGRLVQIHPPRRLGSGMKLALRSSIGIATARSSMNRRRRVLRAPSRVTVFLIVTRSDCPGFASIGMIQSPVVVYGSLRNRLRIARGRKYTNRRRDDKGG